MIIIAVASVSPVFSVCQLQKTELSNVEDFQRDNMAIFKEHTLISFSLKSRRDIQYNPLKSLFFLYNFHKYFAVSVDI